MLFYRATLPLSSRTLAYIAWRYVTQTIGLLAARSPKLRRAPAESVGYGRAHAAHQAPG
jgi:hypothetical protein